MNKKDVCRVLSKIYRIAEASEKGYATSATNIPNPGLKILFKHFAQQRSQHKSNILAALHDLGMDSRPISSLPAIIHRGRINIFAFILAEEEEKEKIVLKEIEVGEKFGIMVYQWAIKQDLPPPTGEMIQRQLTEIQENNVLVRQLLGEAGEKISVQLIELQPASKTSIQLLSQDGAGGGTVQEIELSDAELYHGLGATVLETVLSGAFGGALWGGLMGLLAGFGVVQTTIPAPLGIPAALELWAVPALALLAVGAFISAGLALFIGLGTSEQGAHQFRNDEGRYHLHIQSRL